MKRALLRVHSLLHYVMACLEIHSIIWAIVLKVKSFLSGLRGRRPVSIEDRLNSNANCTHDGCATSMFKLLMYTCWHGYGAVIRFISVLSTDVLVNDFFFLPALTCYWTLSLRFFHWFSVFFCFFFKSCIVSLELKNVTHKESYYPPMKSWLNHWCTVTWYICVHYFPLS